MAPRPRDAGVYDYRKTRARILANSDVCHLCGHNGADTVDHLIPVSRGGTHHEDNLAPAHGVNGCPTCGRKCNSEKGARPRTTGHTQPPAGCTTIPDSQRYLTTPEGQHGYWDTVTGTQVSVRWLDD